MTVNFSGRPGLGFCAVLLLFGGAFAAASYVDKLHGGGAVAEADTFPLPPPPAKAPIVRVVDSSGLPVVGAVVGVFDAEADYRAARAFPMGNPVDDSERRFVSIRRDRPQTSRSNSKGVASFRRPMRPAEIVAVEGGRSGSVVADFRSEDDIVVVLETRPNYVVEAVDASGRAVVEGLFVLEKRAADGKVLARSTRLTDARGAANWVAPFRSGGETFVTLWPPAGPESYASCTEGVLTKLVVGRTVRRTLDVSLQPNFLHDAEVFLTSGATPPDEAPGPEAVSIRLPGAAMPDCNTAPGTLFARVSRDRDGYLDDPIELKEDAVTRTLPHAIPGTYFSVFLPDAPMKAERVRGQWTFKGESDLRTGVSEVVGDSAIFIQPIRRDAAGMTTADGLVAIEYGRVGPRPSRLVVQDSPFRLRKGETGQSIVAGPVLRSAFCIDVRDAGGRALPGVEIEIGADNPFILRREDGVLESSAPVLKATFVTDGRGRIVGYAETVGGWVHILQSRKTPSGTIGTGRSSFVITSPAHFTLTM